MHTCINGAITPVFTMPIKGWTTSKNAASWHEANISLTAS